MGLSETIRDLLAADATLTALLIGGIYSFEQTGRNGLSRATTPNAYNGFLQPCAVIKAGDVQTIPAIRDSAAGSRQTVAVFLYDDSSYGSILTARDRVLALLDRQWINGAGFVERVGGSDDARDPKLNNAALIRLDFEVTN